MLCLSNVINGQQRLGQDGAKYHGNATLFPPAQYRTVDCSAFDDYDRDFQSSHQYYRRSPRARADIAAVMDHERSPGFAAEAMANRPGAD